MVLQTIAISWFIANSTLVEKPRMWLSKQNRLLGDLLHCEICLSFWVGLALTQDLLKAFGIMGIQILIAKALTHIKKKKSLYRDIKQTMLEPLLLVIQVIKRNLFSFIILNGIYVFKNHLQ